LGQLRFCPSPPFAFQQTVWQDFARSAPPMLIDRMVEGYGAQTLSPLDGLTSRELIGERLKATVWGNMVDAGPPADQPCFPFTAEEVRRMRIDSAGELRAFLQLAQREFEQRLTRPAKPSPRASIQLTSIEPREVISHEPTAVLIRGENFPADVRVTFAGQPSPSQPVCRPAVGEVDVTTPTGLIGDVEVCVEAADAAENASSLKLRFVEREVPRPYRQHIDGQRLRARRLECRLTQKDVADRVQSLQPKIPQLQRVKDWQPYISRVENERWDDAPDELYVRLAEVYEKPLSYFLRSSA
jgi:hypothetical protein